MSSHPSLCCLGLGQLSEPPVSGLPLTASSLADPGCCDPGLWGMDSCRQEQLHFRPT